MRLLKPTHEQKTPLLNWCLILIFAAYLVVSTIVISRPVYAETISDLQSTVRKASLLHAFSICMIGGKNEHGLSENLFLKQDREYFGFYRALPGGDTWVSSSKKVSLGYAATGDSDGQWNCSTSSHMDAFVKALGYINVEDFLNKNYHAEEDGGNLSQWDKHLKANGGIDALKNKLQKEVVEALNKLQYTDAHRYYNAQQSFVQCAGSRNSNSTYIDHPIKVTNYIDTSTNSIIEGVSYFERAEANQVPIGHHETIGQDDNDGKMACENIASILTRTSEAYKDWLTKNDIETNTYDTSDANIPTAIEGAEDDSCESNSGVLGWVMCPVMSLLNELVDFLDSKIQQQLVFKDEYLQNKELETAWSRIRNIAYVILIPIMLVMVIGTALGTEVFSAYTVKKAMPRMVIAIIFIALSWQICSLLINVTNALGGGIKGIVTSPFDVENGLKGAIGKAEIGGASTGALTGIGVLGLGAVVFTGAMTPGIIGSTLASAGLILGGVFLLLVLRQIIIIALLLIAPVAILSWIFPGNDKIWKLWWGSFSKLLLLFPLIMLLMGVGQIFASVTGTVRGNTDDSGLVSFILVTAAYVMPYVFIPFAFKWAGGVFGNLAGMVNDKNRGALDRLKKGRSASRSKNYQDFKAGTGTQIGQRNRFAKGIGTRVGVGAGNRFGYTAKGRQAMDQHLRSAAVNNVMKGDKWDGINQNDNALLAATYDNAAAAKKGLMEDHGMSNEDAKRAIAAVNASVGFGRPQAIAAAQQLVSTGTGYTNLEQMVETLSRAAGGNVSTASALAGFANAETKKANRHDLAPGYSTLNSLVQSSMEGNIDEDALHHAEASTTQASSVYELVNSKPQSIENQARAHARMLDPTSNASDQERMVASAFFKELEAGLPNAKGGNRDTIRRILDGQIGTDPPSNHMDNVRDFDRTLVDDPSGNGNMMLVEDIVRNNYVREYRRPDPNNTP